MLIQVAETKQQAAQELQDAREQVQLHSQLLQEQDEEVQKLRKLLEVQHEQMTAQEQQQSQELNSLQECIREQRQHAAELQQRAVRQEAEGLFNCNLYPCELKEDSTSCSAKWGLQCECMQVTTYTCMLLL